MTVRRLVSVLSVVLIASATVVVAQPKKPAPKADKGATGAKGPTGATGAKKAPVAPAKDPVPTPGAAGSAAAGSGSDAGSAVQMTEDPPPSDMEGTNENPDAPHGTGEVIPGIAAVPKQAPRAGYPVEEVNRPITLPQNMSEVSLSPHAQLSPYAGADALRARYGITRQVQLGLTYVLGGIYADKDFIAGSMAGTKFHPGKAVGLDVTILLQNWIGVRIGVPIYISPLAVSLSLGAPMKFVFGDKFALGGLDDLLNIKLKRFAPSFYQEAANAVGRDNDAHNTIQSGGVLRFSFYGIYQHDPRLAIIGRAGLNLDDFGSGALNIGSTTTFLRAGLQYTPRKYLDIGGSLGFDDLAHGGSFSPQFLLAVRI